MFRFGQLFSDRYFENVSDERFGRFCSKHLALLKKNPNCVGLVSPTQQAFEYYYGSISGQGDLKAVRAMRTQTVYDLMAEFQDLVSRHAGAIASRWGKDSPEYQRFLPRGVSEFRQANLQTIGALMERYQNALKEYRKELPAQVYTDFLEPCREGDSLGGGVIPRFLRARSEQLDAKGEVESVRRQQTHNRKALEDRIVENALALASTVVRSSIQDKKEALRMFPKHLLRRSRSAPASEAGHREDMDTAAATAGHAVEERALKEASAPVVVKAEFAA